MPSREERIVEGYHGTYIQAVDDILSHRFEISRNEYDWLGDGIYFFEYGRERAWEWAEEKYGAEAAVIGAKIALIDCMDLLDTKWMRVLIDAYDGFLDILKQSSLAPPRQTSGAHRLDREVINYAIGELGRISMEIRCVRGAFREGRPVYPDSAIFDKIHIQIAVRDQEVCIRVVPQ